MATPVVVAILAAVLIWVVLMVLYLVQRQRSRSIAELIVGDGEYSFGDAKHVKTFFFEKKIINALNVPANRVRQFVWLERILILVLCGVLIAIMGLVAVAIILGVGVVFFSRDSNRNLVYESGIDNIETVTNFINTFVPNITSGKSGDQAMVVFMDSLDDDNPIKPMVEDWFANRDSQTFDRHQYPAIKEIIEIYEIVRYNEEQGSSDYIYILEELQRDYSQKQQYYTSFVTRISEINPICWSYYVAVPIIMFLSYTQTESFWWGVGGLICVIIIVAMFCAFEFFVYKIRKNTIKSIF